MILFFYTALKRLSSDEPYEAVWWSFSFTLLSNTRNLIHHGGMFDDPFLLHCSQTKIGKGGLSNGLMILFFYTALKHRVYNAEDFVVWWSFSFTLLSNIRDDDSNNVGSLMILFFYTALKRLRDVHRRESGLMILFFYTALKLPPKEFQKNFCLMILFFYTALKQKLIRL